MQSIGKYFGRQVYWLDYHNFTNQLPGKDWLCLAIANRPYVQALHNATTFYVSTHPNAGLPNQFGGYDQSTQELATLISEFAKSGWLNIVGGCCGTTPAHIKAIAEAVKGKPPRERFRYRAQQRTLKELTDKETQHLIENWSAGPDRENMPTFSLPELITILSKVNDERCFFKLKAAFEKEKKLYHPEQILLLNAHIFGKQQCFSAAAN